MLEISVIIPVYNVKKYLPQCLDSVMNQTLEDMEIICIDDGSTDGSGNILDEYARQDERIRVIHKRNTGYGNSMNVGLDHAGGKYIAIIESDDFAEPDMIEKLYLAAEKSGAEITKANHYDYKRGVNSFHNRLKDCPKNKITNSRDCPEVLYLADTIWTCLYRRSFLTKYGIRFHETPGASFQDISFSIQGWLWAKRVYFIEDGVLHYRNDNPNSSMHNPTKIFNVFDEYEWLEKKYEGFWILNPELEKYFVSVKYGDYISHYHRVAAQYQYALLLRTRKSMEMDIQKGRIQEEFFPLNLWKNISDIRENLNAFFLKSAKDYKDPRLEACEFKNESVYEDAVINRIKDFPHIIIYGAGEVGQKMAEEMLRKAVAVDCFAVTEFGNNAKMKMGIPVKELKEVVDWSEDSAVIIAVTEKSQYELYKNLEKYHFKNIYRVDSIVRKSFSKRDKER